MPACRCRCRTANVKGVYRVNRNSPVQTANENSRTGRTGWPAMRSRVELLPDDSLPMTRMRGRIISDPNFLEMSSLVMLRISEIFLMTLPYRSCSSSGRNSTMEFCKAFLLAADGLSGMHCRLLLGPFGPSSSILTTTLVTSRGASCSPSGAFRLPSLPEARLIAAAMFAR